MILTRKQIHDLNNDLNRITIICSWLRDRLEDEPLNKMSSEQLKEINQDFVKGLSDLEQAAMNMAKRLCGDRR